MKLKIAFSLLCCTFALSIGPVQAAGYPDRPIRMIVPFAPGGGADITARIIGEGLAKQLGQPVIVDNRAGAGGAIGANAVVRSEPDGYTILYTTPGQQITLPYLMKSLPYSPDDLKPVSQLALVPSVLVINKNLPVKNVQELIDLARKKPEQIHFGSAGIGASSHLNGELLQSIARIKLVHVPYKGTSEESRDLIAGHIEMAIDTIGVYLPQIQAGTVIPLGVTTPEPVSLLPGVPSIAATLPGYDPSPINYLTVPAKTPDNIVQILSKAVNKTVQDPDVQKKLLDQAILARANTPEEMAALVKSEQVKWKKVIDEAGIQPQ